MKMPRSHTGSAMIIACPACESRFNVDPARLAPSGRTVKCAKCGYRWRVDAEGQPAPQPEPPAPPVEPDLPPGPSARDILAEQAAAATAAHAVPEPDMEAPPEDVAGVLPPEPSPPAEPAGPEVPAVEEDGAAARGAESEAGPEAEAVTEPPLPEAEAEAPPEAGGAEEPAEEEQTESDSLLPDPAALTPRQRQKLQDAQKGGGSRTRVLLLFLLVLVSVVALVGLMKGGPTIERALQKNAQPVAPAAEPAQTGQGGGQ